MIHPFENSGINEDDDYYSDVEYAEYISRENGTSFTDGNPTESQIIYNDYLNEAMELLDTDIERQIFELLANEYTDKEIYTELRLTKSVFYTAKKNIQKKLKNFLRN